MPILSISKQLKNETIIDTNVVLKYWYKSMLKDNKYQVKVKII